MIKLLSSLFIVILILSCAYALPTPKKTTLSWIAPITNIDGTQLTDLGGYKIYWSTVSGVYIDSDSKDIGITLSTSIPITSTGTYYFVVTAYDAAGNESDFSNEVSAKLFRGINPVVLQIK